jgi:hypothetical protein
MKLENGCYIDENNNKWDAIFFTSEQANKNSLNLIDCRDCSDCRDCRDCIDCIDCSENPQRY